MTDRKPFHFVGYWGVPEALNGYDPTKGIGRADRTRPMDCPTGKTLYLTPDEYAQVAENMSGGGVDLIEGISPLDTKP